jgi:alkanesulfonate monooxygenase SsuD/methylene tetrahydromethanopterin reductase-like flavin-dependent oxidoreductase (luciferase family)
LFTKLKKNGRIELFKNRIDQPEEEVTEDFVFDRLVFWGSPGRVADQILEFKEQVGDFGTLLYAGKDWLDPESGQKSMRLMAEKVLPRIGG